MLLLFSIFIVLLIISASPLLGSFNIPWSLPIMFGLFAILLVAGWVLLIFYPLFS